VQTRLLNSPDGPQGHDITGGKDGGRAIRQGEQGLHGLVATLVGERGVDLDALVVADQPCAL